MGVAFAYCMGIAYALSAIGALAVFPVMLVSVSALVALVTTIVKAPDALFGTRDLDRLLSLPIPARTVATARVLKIYGMDLLFTLLILVPGGVAYGILARPAPAFYVSYALCALAAPMLPAVAASLLGALVALAGASIKRLRYAGPFPDVRRPHRRGGRLELSQLHRRQRGDVHRLRQGLQRSLCPRLSARRPL